MAMLVFGLPLWWHLVLAGLTAAGIVGLLLYGLRLLATRCTALENQARKDRAHVQLFRYEVDRMHKLVCLMLDGRAHEYTADPDPAAWFARADQEADA